MWTSRSSSNTGARSWPQSRTRSSVWHETYFARPERALFADIRRYFPITAQAQVSWAVSQGIGAAVSYVEEQIEAGAFDGGAARCQATTRKGKPCQRTPLPEREYCPSHQHLETGRTAASARVAA